MRSDAFEMALVHRIFRKELTAVPDLIRSARPGERGRVKQVAGHIANVLAALHHHHLAEDELLWPKLHDRVPLHAEDFQRMESEHEFIAKAIVGVESRLADWVAATASTTTQPATQPQAAEILVCEIEELRKLVDDHLSVEEERVVPLINENLTDAEWRAVTERGGSFLGPRNMWFGLAFVGMALEQCTNDERRRFLAGMPPPQRLLVRLFERRAMTSYRVRLGRTRAV
jgi:hemerythrin-like domain-containing protein